MDFLIGLFIVLSALSFLTLYSECYKSKRKLNREISMLILSIGLIRSRF